MDIALALLLISASIVMVGVYLSSEGDQLDESEGDRTAETLAAATTSATYNMSDIQEDEHFEEPEIVGSYERSTYGPASSLLADAAVASADVGDHTFIRYGDTLEESVAANIDSALVGANHEVYVIASWEPYHGSAIGGNATAGSRSPVTEDVSSASFSVDSGMSEIDLTVSTVTQALNDDDIDHNEILAEAIAESVVEGYFPPTQTQLTLEQQGLDRAVSVTHYQRLADIVESETDADVDIDEDDLDRDEANVDALNEALVDGLTAYIHQDIESSTFGAELAELEETDADHATVSELLEDRLSIDTVDVTVQTWDP